MTEPLNTSDAGTWKGWGWDRTHWQGNNNKERSVSVASAAGLPGAQKNACRHAASPCTDFA